MKLVLKDGRVFHGELDVEKSGLELLYERTTPQDGQPCAAIHRVGTRLAQLRKGLRGRVDLRPASARWAWVEHVLAQGGPEQGLAVHQAVLAGGGFRRLERALCPR